MKLPKPPASAVVAIGTYTQRMPHVNGTGAGIHLMRFDSDQGICGAETATGGLRNPSYLAASASGDRLYAVCEVDAAASPTVETYAIDQPALRLTHLASTPIAGGWPCHVSLDPAGRRLFVSNYETGSLVVMELDASGCPSGEAATIQRAGSGPQADRQEAPHVHCALAGPDGRHLYLCDLGTDAIARHPIHDGQVAETPDLVIPARPGAGPRHIAFSPSGLSLIAIHELCSTISLHGLADPQRSLAEISTLPGDWTGANTCAALRIGPSGRFVYASNRGHDSLFLAELDEAAGALRPVGHWPAGGRTPRDIALSPDGRFLLAALQDDDRVTIFAVDTLSGRLTPTGRWIGVRSPVCLCFIPPPPG